MTDKQFAKYLVHAKGGEIGKRRGWFVAVPRLLNYIPTELVRHVTPLRRLIRSSPCLDGLSVSKIEGAAAA